MQGRAVPLPEMALAKVLLAAVLLAAFAFGVYFATTHGRDEVEAYLTRSRVVTRVMLQVAVALLAVGVVGLVIANAV